MKPINVEKFQRLLIRKWRKAHDKRVKDIRADAAPAHEWFQFSNLVACRACGVVRRADDKNSPCKGPVRVALRDTDAAPAVCVWTGEEYVTYSTSCENEHEVDPHKAPPTHCPTCGKPIRFTEAK